MPASRSLTPSGSGPMPLRQPWLSGRPYARLWRKLTINDLALFLAVALLVLITLGDTTGSGPAQPRLAGEVTEVHAGDLIEVDGVAVRLDGLEALDETGAAAFLRKMALGQRVDCALTGRTGAKGATGTCTLDGADLAARIVAAGLARK